jgi:hypothetical protein
MSWGLSPLAAAFKDADGSIEFSAVLPNNLLKPDK